MEQRRRPVDPAVVKRSNLTVRPVQQVVMIDNPQKQDAEFLAKHQQQVELAELAAARSHKRARFESVRLSDGVGAGDVDDVEEHERDGQDTDTAGMTGVSTRGSAASSFGSSFTSARYVHGHHADDDDEVEDVTPPAPIPDKVAIVVMRYNNIKQVGFLLAQ